MSKEKKEIEVGTKKNFDLVIETLESYQKRLAHKSVCADDGLSSQLFGESSYEIKKAIEAIKNNERELVIK